MLDKAQADSEKGPRAMCTQMRLARRHLLPSAARRFAWSAGCLAQSGPPSSPCSHRKKRMRQIQKMSQRGLLDPEKEDPFSLFVVSKKACSGVWDAPGMAGGDPCSHWPQGSSRACLEQ